MLTTLLSAVCVFLLAVIYYNKRQHNQEISDMNVLIDATLRDNFDLKMRDNVQSYYALEQGMQEMEENYEVDRVGLLEQIRTKDDRIQELSDKLHNERGLCLDRQTVILFLNDELREAQEAGLRLQQHITDHEGSCLPVFTMNEQGALEIKG